MGESSGLLCGDVSVHPFVAAEADGVGDGEVEAGVPVNDNEDVQHHLAYPEGVGEVGASLRLVEELTHPREPEQGSREVLQGLGCD